jgi:hypothetical protein
MTPEGLYHDATLPFSQAGSLLFHPRLSKKL